jgi:hypothetical protein
MPQNSKSVEYSPYLYSGENLYNSPAGTFGRPMSSWLGTYIGDDVLTSINALFGSHPYREEAVDRLDAIKSRVSDPEQFREILSLLMDLASKEKLPQRVGEFPGKTTGLLRDFLDKNYPDPRILPTKLKEKESISDFFKSYFNSSLGEDRY